jgi:hypothetical protein
VEINTNCGLVVTRIEVVDITLNDGSLSSGGISKNKNLHTETARSLRQMNFEDTRLKITFKTRDSVAPGVPPVAGEEAGAGEAILFLKEIEVDEVFLKPQNKSAPRRFCGPKISPKCPNQFLNS